MDDGARFVIVKYSWMVLGVESRFGVREGVRFDRASSLPGGEPLHFDRLSAAPALYPKGHTSHREP